MYRVKTNAMQCKQCSERLGGEKEKGREDEVSTYL